MGSHPKGVIAMPYRYSDDECLYSHCHSGPHRVVGEKSSGGSEETNATTPASTVFVLCDITASYFGRAVRHPCFTIRLII